MATAKPVFVRVKRKQFQEPLDAFWLEINERPLKKPLLDISSLSISDSTAKQDAKSKKVLVQHVETISTSEVARDVLKSFLPDSCDPGALRKKIEERRCMLKQNIKKSDRSIAIQKHEDFARSARFEQIWKSRREKGQQNDKVLHKMCDLYDVVRIDSDDEMPNEFYESTNSGANNDEILSYYLPLLKEYVPEAATEIESDLALRQDTFVYDIYTVEDEMNKSDEDALTEYPLVQVNDADDYYDDQSESEYDSDDSNAENSDLHDYPDEESSEDEEQSEEEEEEKQDSQNEFDDLVGSDYGYEEDDASESLSWRYR